MDGYQPLIAEIREIVGRIAVSCKDEQLAVWALSGPITVNEDGDDVRFISPAMPSGRLQSPEAYSDVSTWTVDRAVLVELVLRTTSARAQRWLVAEQRLLADTDDWQHVIREHSGVRFQCELSIGVGWVDLLLAVDEWIIEIGQPATWGQIKQKFGELRAYPDSSLSDRQQDIIGYAESIVSEKICEFCGAPGRKQDRNGWYYTSCDEHTK
jgi:hypothetical protein